MDIDLLVKLSARAWALPILAALAAGTPGRQAALLAATGAGRSAFQASLGQLVALGLVARAGGHGHPLRPEFTLTARGAEIAALAARLDDLVPDAGAALLRRSWTLPVLAVTRSPRRFGEIRAGLPGITDRALSLSLQGLEDQRWMRRAIAPDTRPARAFYQATGPGAQISALLAAA